MLSVPKCKALYTQLPARVTSPVWHDGVTLTAPAQANVPASAAIPWVVWVCQFLSVCSPACLGALQGRGTRTETPVASRLEQVS